MGIRGSNLYHGPEVSGGASPPTDFLDKNYCPRAAPDA